MAEEDDSFTLVAKRATKAAPKGTKRAERQLQRHGPKPPIRHNCRHAKGVYRCGEITDEDLFAFNLNFYSHTKKIDQDNFGLKYLVISKKKNRWQRKQLGHIRVINECETSFFASKSFKETVRVCKDFFLKALSVGRKRVDNIAKSFHTTSTLRKENRGGDRKDEKFQPKRRAVKTFIKSLIGRESHYSRSKSRKIYLSPKLKSIKHLWNLYKTKNPNIPVKYEFLRRIFHKDFRIGFGSPKTDACSMCERLRNEIKNEADQIIKQNLITQLTIHKRRTNVFYELLNEKRDGLKVLCFDHEQNQVLPKVPDQQAYYTRQLYVYNFSRNQTGWSLGPRERYRAHVERK
ncbi:hypothetical protein ElyMa_002361000 [Elysia marginata]|uniref:Uncharacterized protein n=1 Tax=Elysia marginata TaxID=1093978 RepID=A0AAV4GAJ2_9GAST|nr:hypothetical protein ElyMa_002361000 [Elysia marginata]